MTKEELTAIDHRLQAAMMSAPGPWGARGASCSLDVIYDLDGMGALWPVCQRPALHHGLGLSDAEWAQVAEFIAEAPNDIRRLLEEVRQLQGAL